MQQHFLFKKVLFLSLYVKILSLKIDLHINLLWSKEMTGKVQNIFYLIPVKGTHLSLYVPPVSQDLLWSDRKSFRNTTTTQILAMLLPQHLPLTRGKHHGATWEFQ